MADYTDTKVSQLVINNLTQEKFEELKAKGELQDDQIYCTPDTTELMLSGKQDKATALNYGDISNCILEIPQDIKLELNNGTLTLKAGSKVYVPNGFTGAEETVQYYCWGPVKGNYVYTKSATPSVGDMMYSYINGTMEETSGAINAGNITYTDGTSIGNDNGYTYPRYATGDTQVTTAAGTPKFDEITIESDHTVHAGTNSGAGFIRVYSTQDAYLDAVAHASGKTVPSGFTGLFYNTAENIIRMVSNGVESQTDRIAFPIGVGNYNNGVVTAITSVLSGFGRIGSTIFGTKGVKVLVPNGKKPDGTNNNYTYTLPTVITRQVSGTGTNLGLAINTTANTFGVGSYSYSVENNTVNASGGVSVGRVMIGHVTYVNSSVTDIKTKQVYHALDYNKLEEYLPKTGGDLLGTLRLKPNILASSIDETEIMLLSGSTTSNGALFVVYGQNGVTSGAFLARAANSSGTYYDLIGQPNGALSWGGKHVLRELAGYLGPRGYIKLNTGLIIQWGHVTGVGEGDWTVVFPVPFSTGGTYAISKHYASTHSSAVQYREINFWSRSSTGATTYNQGGVNSGEFDWIAMGY